jgi:hypothetical protein
MLKTNTQLRDERSKGPEVNKVITKVFFSVIRSMVQRHGRNVSSEIGYKMTFCPFVLGREPLERITEDRGDHLPLYELSSLNKPDLLWGLCVLKNNINC